MAELVNETRCVCLHGVMTSRVLPREAGRNVRCFLLLRKFASSLHLHRRPAFVGTHGELQFDPREAGEYRPVDRERRDAGVANCRARRTGREAGLLHPQGKVPRRWEPQSPPSVGSPTCGHPCVLRFFSFGGDFDIVDSMHNPAYHVAGAFFTLRDKMVISESKTGNKLCVLQKKIFSHQFLLNCVGTGGASSMHCYYLGFPRCSTPGPRQERKPGKRALLVGVLLASWLWPIFLLQVCAALRSVHIQARVRGPGEHGNRRRHPRVSLRRHQSAALLCPVRLPPEV